jgi:SSS family solute:Na+ symporter
MCFSKGAWRDPFTSIALPVSSPSLTRLGSIQYNADVFSRFGTSVDDSFTIPLVTAMRDADDTAFTLLLSPEDLTPELLLRIDGSAVTLARLFQRLDPSATHVQPLQFTMMLRAHAADWRPALKFWADAFPSFVLPHVPDVSQFDGLGGYSWIAPNNASYAQSVGFKTNWDLSGTFMPYDGLFAPYQSSWLNLGPINAGLPQYNVTYALIEDFYQKVQAAGLNSLSYFDVGNWGVSIDTTRSWPNTTCGVRPGGGAAPCPDPAGSNAFLQHFLTPALLQTGYSVAGGVFFNHTFSDWVGTTLMDPAEPFFQALLIEQLQRRIDLTQSMQGIAIDRFDYTNYYNAAFDDGVSFVPGFGAVRSLLASHLETYKLLAAVLHAKNQSMFGNCNTLCRADLLGPFDGGFSEGAALNAVAWNGIRGRTTILWTYSLSATGDLDAVFQQHLYVRVWPMAPMLGNDHSINPGDPAVQAAYERYAPLFDELRGVEYLLDAHPVSLISAAPDALANVFVSVASLYLRGTLFVVIVFNSAAYNATVSVAPGDAAFSVYDAVALVPGGAPVHLGRLTLGPGGALLINTPTSRGAAIVRLTPVPPRQAPVLVAYLGSTPTLDGRINPAEWADATVFGDIALFDPEFAPVIPSTPIDLNVSGYVKHDGRSLFFAFVVSDNLLYAYDTPAWLPMGNPSANNLTQNGWPWFGDELEILLNAKGNFSSPSDGITGVPGLWQMVVNAHKSRLGGIGVPGLLEGEPRASPTAWANYQAWIFSRAMRAAVAVSPAGPSGSGSWTSEIAIDFDPMLELAPGVFWNTSWPATTMGINIAIGDTDQPSEGDPEYGLRHEMWFSGNKGCGLQGNCHCYLDQFGQLVLQPTAKAT